MSACLLNKWIGKIKIDNIGWNSYLSPDNEALFVATEIVIFIQKSGWISCIINTLELLC